ncbi:MAG: hypothetical protein AAF696_33275 [Bacteroidota bacterium]
MNKIYLILISFLIFPHFLSSQSFQDEKRKASSNWFIQLNYGLPFLQEFEPQFAASLEPETSSAPSFYGNLTLGYQYYLSNKLSLKVGASYERANFIQTEQYEVDDIGFGGFYRGEIKDTYLTHSLLFPLQFSYHLNRFSVSVGLLPYFHLKSRIDVEQKYWRAGRLDVFEYEEEIIYRDADRFVVDTRIGAGRANLSLDNKINLQMAIGFQYQLLKRLSLDIGLRQNVFKNELQRIIIQRSPSGDDRIISYEIYPRTLSLGISYSFFEGNLKDNLMEKLGN